MSRAPHLDQIVDGGMHRHEQDIMRRWDAGDSIEKIIDERGGNPATIRSIISMYGNAEAQARTYDAMVRRGSAALAAAIAATGKRYS